MSVTPSVASALAEVVKSCGDEDVTALVASFLRERRHRKRLRQMLHQLILQACIEDEESANPQPSAPKVHRPEPTPHPSSPRYLLHLYRSATDHTAFQACFGVSPSTAEEVARVVGVAWAKIEPSKFLRDLGVDKMVATALHYLATEECALTKNFVGLCRSQVVLCLKRVCGTIRGVKHEDFIKWPSSHAEFERVANEYETISGLPGVVGAIGACNIMWARGTQEVQTSVILQATCTTGLQFTHCHCGKPGNVDPVAVLKESDLYRCPRVMFPEDQFHLVGSRLYPLKNWLLVPFREGEILTSDEAEYDVHLPVMYTKIDHAFSALKSRFMRLDTLVHSDNDSITDVIISCCILHNMELKRQADMAY